MADGATDQTGDDVATTSRRRLLKGGIVVAGAAAAGVAGAKPAGADTTNPPLIVDADNVGTGTTTLHGSKDAPALVVTGRVGISGRTLTAVFDPNQPIPSAGVYGVSGDKGGNLFAGPGVLGVAGVLDPNQPIPATGVYGVAPTAGVVGVGSKGPGVVGAAGRLVSDPNQPFPSAGVYGVGPTISDPNQPFPSAGVYGVGPSVSDPNQPVPSAGVYGVSAISDPNQPVPSAGVYGVGRTGILGRSNDISLDPNSPVSAAAVYGLAGASPAVVGRSSSGIGVVAHGGQAPLRLLPSTSVGAPASGTHQVGELFIDSTGALFCCRAAGAPGTWVRIGFNPLVPFRVCDTRPGTGTPYSGKTVQGGPGGILAVQIASSAGKSGGVPTGAASAVVCNVTIVNPTADSFLSVFPAGSPRPNASNLNWRAGQAPTPNQVTCGLDGGAIALFNNSGAVDVLVDVVGFFS